MINLRVDEELRLRQLREEDAATLFALIDGNRDYLAPWLPWVPLNTEVAHSLAFIRDMRELARGTGTVTAGLFLDGELKGVIGHHKIDRDNRKAEIGYWLQEASSRRGIMTRACRALVSYSFQDLKMHRVEIRCAADNRASRGIPERLGFVEEGRHRDGELVRGRFHDLVIYGMLEHEWVDESE